MSAPLDFSPQCPLPLTQYPHVLLAHGGGGRLSHQLIESLFLPAFRNPALEARHDGAVLEIGGLRLAFSTDSYVVRPMFFPGGDIGSLAVHGTVNDLAMCGARPLYLSVAAILEEGVPMDTLRRVVASMQTAAARAGVQLVTGDTKVVDRGKGDGIYLNTTGLGLLEHPLRIGPASVRPGDAILLNGDIGRHGMAIMAVREGLAFESAIESDSAPLAALVLALLEAGIEIHCLRDLTRGGLASALIEIAEAARLDMLIEEAAIPVREDVRAACEILGLDPLYVANEGRLAVLVPEAQAEQALALMRAQPHGEGSCRIGRVQAAGEGLLQLRSRIGALRIVDMLSGEQLPRIC
ncbi:MAG: hydrogenase expression/formation protein HypE [Verrucomicrobiae bacterium]|nr:hydrogenase expression/formation protein HypE [Verrucomicrobiae bacterium]